MNEETIQVTNGDVVWMVLQKYIENYPMLEALPEIKEDASVLNFFPAPDLKDMEHYENLDNEHFVMYVAMMAEIENNLTDIFGRVPAPRIPYTKLYGLQTLQSIVLYFCALFNDGVNIK